MLFPKKKNTSKIYNRMQVYRETISITIQSPIRIDISQSNIYITSITSLYGVTANTK